MSEPRAAAENRAAWLLIAAMVVVPLAAFVTIPMLVVGSFLAEPGDGSSTPFGVSLTTTGATFALLGLAWIPLRDGTATRGRLRASGMCSAVAVCLSVLVVARSLWLFV